jgi:cbb3-type cytochrome oxidase cytochrome c subunit
MKTRVALVFLALLLISPLGCKKETSPSSGSGGGGQSATVTVYATRTGTKYHRAGCRYLSKSQIPMPLEQAKQRYGPCSVCNPPQ